MSGKRGLTVAPLIASRILDLVTWADIEVPDTEAVRVRKDMEVRFSLQR
jgi:hypothetical protein